MIADILLTFLLTGCLPVEGEKVVARDLTGASAVFAALPADAAFGYAPAPGAQRLLNATELKRLAWPQDLALDPGFQLCVVRPLEPLDGERLVEAMRSALAWPEARIELAEMAAFGAPRGQIEFPLAGLRRPPPASPGQPVLWPIATKGRGAKGLHAAIKSPRALPYSANESIAAGSPVERPWPGRSNTATQNFSSRHRDIRFFRMPV